MILVRIILVIGYLCLLGLSIWADCFVDGMSCMFM